MTEKELLKDLNLEDRDIIENDNGSDSIELNDSNDYDRIRSRLDRLDYLEIDEEASGTFNLQYVNDDFVITLVGNFEEDTYKLVIRETNYI